MRGTRRVGFVVTLILVMGAIGPLGAAGPVQTCIGPASSAQSGRASFAPGVSNLKVAQRIDLRINLFHCTPANTDRGSATLNDTITPNGPQTCRLFTVPTVWKSTATVTWKNHKVSTIPITYSLTGASQLVDIKGTVTSGLFAGYAVSAQLRYTKVVSPAGKYPHGSGIAQACVNQVPPTKYGRVAIASIDFYTTKHFTIG